MFGIGLRQVHYPFLESRPKTQLDWFEAISENYMNTKGRPLEMLELIRMDYPVALHGVGLSIASDKPLNMRYLNQLKDLINRIDPFVVSDHLCWTSTASHQLHDLLPFPMNEESLQIVAGKIDQTQSFLKRPLLLENVSSYLQFNNSECSEWEFLSALVKHTGCKILLDVNNIYVSACNHHFDPIRFIENIPHESVAQIHLAGHIDTGQYLFDTHSRPVCDEVWNLYQRLCELLPKSVPTLIEWDADIPDFEAVEAQALLAKNIWTDLHAKTKSSRFSKPFCSSSGLQRFQITDL